MGKLLLYLKGAFFQEADIELPAFQQLDKNLYKNFELNCELRSEYVKAEATKLKIQYLRQVIKCEYQFEIYLQVESKIEQPYFLTTEAD